MIIDQHPPEVVVPSGFDPIRWDIRLNDNGRHCLEDGRIHPARIEELVE